MGGYTAGYLDVVVCFGEGRREVGAERDGAVDGGGDGVEGEDEDWEEGVSCWEDEDEEGLGEAA